MKRILFAIVFVFLFAPLASAQIVVAPASAVFAHPDADFAITAAYHTDFFTCASVTTAGVCVGQSATPFQAGFDTLKANVTGNAAARVIDLKAAPASGLLASVPLGTGMVAVVIAIGDTSVPGVFGNSQASNFSNAFFSKPRTPAAPGAPAVR